MKDEKKKVLTENLVNLFNELGVDNDLKIPDYIIANSVVDFLMNIKLLVYCLSDIKEGSALTGEEER